METKIDRLQKLIEELKQNGQSKRNVAKLVGVTHTTVNKWAKGEAFPETDSLQKLADIRGCSLNALRKYLENGIETEDSEEFLSLESQINRIVAEVERLPVEGLIRVNKATIAVLERMPILGKNNSYSCLEKSDNIDFSKGADVTIPELLEDFVRFVSPSKLPSLLSECELSQSRLNEMIAGSPPTDEDMYKIGAILVQAKYKDKHGRSYDDTRLAALRAGRYTNGANR